VCIRIYFSIFSSIIAENIGVDDQICGYTIPDDVFIPGNVVYVNFSSDFSIGFEGFAISVVFESEGN